MRIFLKGFKLIVLFLLVTNILIGLELLNTPQMMERFLYPEKLPISNVNNNLLWQRITLTKSWFLNNFNGDDQLEYEYYPSKNQYSENNNHVRQLATLWSMSELQKLTADTELKQPIKKMLNYYLSFSVCQGKICHLQIDDGAKLAYNAFLILTLNNTPDFPDADDLAEKFAQGIISLQNPDGSYKTDFIQETADGIDYYPGEAMLALMKLYQKDGKEAYRQSIDKAFPYYRQYWRDNKNTAFIPWQTQTYAHLYKVTKNKELADFVFEMNDWLIDNHQVQKNFNKNLLGAFPKDNPRNATGVYLEGINDAYILAEQLNDAEHTNKYLKSLKYGIRYLLLLQYTPETSQNLPEPQKANGGFCHSLNKDDQRIDYTQHALMALIKAYTNKLFPD